MTEPEKTPFAWGGTAVALLRVAKRASDAGDRLPPYAAAEVRQIREEAMSQADRSVAMSENPYIDISSTGEFYPSQVIANEAALRNKRCLYAYTNMRQQALSDAYWQVGQNLPQSTSTCLSPAESHFYRSYNSLASSYQESLGLNLRAHLHSPPQTSEMAFVRGLKNFTYMCPQTGTEVIVSKGKFFVVSQEEAAALTQQGSVEPVIEGPVID
eukprot:TRINITY_DN1067_c1_g1_i1.p1 TRINITY_DN1067_c1_g1~~TRINITY_DN1067_c1_g1_i1.p1  ORF type:complete len:213 (+),score=18.13 TRINITY_DN1067_c1_g1_i1:311-949(+)